MMHTIAEKYPDLRARVTWICRFSGPWCRLNRILCFNDAYYAIKGVTNTNNLNNGDFSAKPFLGHSTFSWVYHLLSPMRYGYLFYNIEEDLKAAFLEFIGTAFFLILGLGGVQAATGENDMSSATTRIEQVLYISTSMGFSLLVSAWLFFRVTGGLFNPNVSLGLALVGVIQPVRFVLYCIAQLVGAIVGAALVDALTPGPLSVKYACVTQIVCGGLTSS